ncbi:MAG: hypothetical protein GY779_00180, partial [Gammaproteobacteria bacterium]|nr:hypothetical protein [Gammaproteobacteria bacterium]
KGFPGIPGGIIHQRKLVVDENSYVVQDKVYGKGNHTIESYLHFHPDIEVQEEGPGCWQLIRDDEPVARIVVENHATNHVTTKVDSGWYCPEFGLRYKNAVLVMTLESTLPAKMGYRIEKAT